LAEEIAKEIDSLLSTDPLTAAKLRAAKQAKGFGDSDDIPF
jgi:hypothetical protein